MFKMRGAGSVACVEASRLDLCVVMVRCLALEDICIYLRWHWNALLLVADIVSLLTSHSQLISHSACTAHAGLTMEFPAGHVSSHRLVGLRRILAGILWKPRLFFHSIFWTRNHKPRREQLWQRLQVDAWKMTKPAEIRCGHEWPDWPGPAGPHSMLPPRCLHVTNAPAVTRPGCEPRAARLYR